MTGGVATALDQALDQLGDGDQAVQALLFGPEDVGALDAPSPLTAAIEPRKRGPGRPKGARGRRTEAVAGWLLSQGRHPILVMMEAYAMSPLELAKAIGIKDPDDAQLIDLLKLQMRMAEAVAPYVAQKLPQAVQVEAAAALQVVLKGVSLPARGGAGQLAEAVEGQVLGVRLPSKSDDPSRTDD